MTPQIIEDRIIRHRSSMRGVVITRVQIIEIAGKRFEAKHWTNFETGTLHHIDSNPIED